MKILHTIVFLLFAVVANVGAQTTKENVMADIQKTGGNYYVYAGGKATLTPAPKGYIPFYISHYGRHGARYMTSNNDYKRALRIMKEAKDADALTDLGREVLKRLHVAADNAEGNAGELTTLGAEQHKGIAERMFHAYPAIFSQPVRVDATSTTVHRCVVSMQAFCNELKSLNPRLQIAMSSGKNASRPSARPPGGGPGRRPGDGGAPPASRRNNHADGNDRGKSLKSEIDAFREQLCQPAHLVSLLFKSKKYVKNSLEDGGEELMDALFSIAQDMQCVPELGLSFYDLFTKEELFDYWQVNNAEWCERCGFFPSGSARYKSQYPLLRSILDTADSVIASGQTCVTLRFGHDTYLAPLAYNLHLKGCDDITEDMSQLYRHWANFRVIPMAGNVQLIFYRKAGSSDILVKFLLCEEEVSIPVKTDIAPYYHWRDVEAFYRAELQN